MTTFKSSVRDHPGSLKKRKKEVCRLAPNFFLLFNKKMVVFVNTTTDAQHEQGQVELSTVLQDD
jgi:hypothetical protein